MAQGRPSLWTPVASSIRAAPSMACGNRRLRAAVGLGSMQPSAPPTVFRRSIITFYCDREHESQRVTGPSMLSCNRWKLASGRRADVIFGLFLLGVPCPGDMILVHGRLARGSRITNARTYAGIRPATVAPVMRERRFTLVIAPDTLCPADLASIKTEIKSIMPRARDFRLALLGASGGSTAGPFSTRAQLNAALREIAPDPNRAWRPDSALEFYSHLPAMLDILAGTGPVLLVGEFPELRPDVQPYAAALLVRALLDKSRSISLIRPTSACSSAPGASGAPLNDVARLTGGASYENLAAFLQDAPYDSSVYSVSWDGPAPARAITCTRSSS